jgi:6-pyruvoyltetrahydropterin/6-carboxytetrahydropterin synthase
MMYRVAVRHDFIARHYLIGGDWGAENTPHAHHYVLELELAGEKLDRHNYLVDITEIEAEMNVLIARYRDHLLNELPEFKGTNPSLEYFARLLCESLSRAIGADNISMLTVRLWENESAWAGFSLER